MTDKHTPEPWRVRFYRTAPTIDCVQGAPEHPEKYGREIINRMARPASERAKNDARRIVACVNALSSISTQAIESGAVAELVSAAGAVIKFCDENKTGGALYCVEQLRTALAAMGVKP